MGFDIIPADACEACVMMAANAEDIRTDADEPTPLGLVDDVCTGINPDGDDEGSFSYDACETCGGLPGMRYRVALMYPAEGEGIDYR